MAYYKNIEWLTKYHLENNSKCSVCLELLGANTAVKTVPMLDVACRQHSFQDLKCYKCLTEAILDCPHCKAPPIIEAGEHKCLSGRDLALRLRTYRSCRNCNDEVAYLKKVTSRLKYI